MPKGKMSRKQLFRVALAGAGLTGQQWAERQGVTLGHLSQVLDEKRESRTLTEKVDAFIEKQLISISQMVA